MKKTIKIEVISFIFITLYYGFCKLTKASLSTVAVIFIDNHILSNSEIAYLASAYYLTGAVMCIPAGIIISKIGFKRSYVLSALILALGTILFALASNFYLFLIARAMCAVTYSFGFTTAIMAIYSFFSEKKLSFFIGMVVFIGYIGAACAGLPVSSITTAENWRYVFIGIGIGIGIGIAQIIFIFITSMLLSKVNHSKGKVRKIYYKEVFRVFSNKRVMLAIAVIGCLTACVFSIGDLWGKVYLVKVFGYSKNEAAFDGNSVIFIATALGGILLGFLEMKRVISWSAFKYFSLVATLSVIVFAYLDVNSAFVVCVLGLLMGLSKSSFVLMYSYIK